jgi:hypothetical protein
MSALLRNRNAQHIDAKTDWWHGWLASLDEANGSIKRYDGHIRR